jgi:hypothetical protein
MTSQASTSRTSSSRSRTSSQTSPSSFESQNRRTSLSFHSNSSSESQTSLSSSGDSRVRRNSTTSATRKNQPKNSDPNLDFDYSYESVTSAPMQRSGHTFAPPSIEEREAIIFGGSRSRSGSSTYRNLTSVPMERSGVVYPAPDWLESSAGGVGMRREISRPVETRAEFEQRMKREGASLRRSSTPRVG